MHRRTIRLLATTTLGLAACGTMHAGVGPHVRHDGKVGATMAASIGIGGSSGGNQLVAVGATLLTMVDDHTHVGGGVNVDYLDLSMRVPMRATLRLGNMVRIATQNSDGTTTDYKGHPTVGLAIAFYPFHTNTDPDEPDYHPSPVEPTWGSFAADVVRPHGKIGGMAGVGVELAVDALPTSVAGDPHELFVSLSLVGEIAIMSMPDK